MLHWADDVCPRHGNGVEVCNHVLPGLFLVVTVPRILLERDLAQWKGHKLHIMSKTHYRTHMMAVVGGWGGG